VVTWEVILANLYAIISNGGTAGMFWGYLIIIVGYLLVYASLAEMSSMVSVHSREWLFQ
jgi:amino acid permease